MPTLGGRRRNLGGERWITYFAMYAVTSSRAEFTAVYRDDVGPCDGGPTGTLDLEPGQEPDEAVRAAICRDIDTVQVPPGRPPDPRWRGPR